MEFKDRLKLLREEKGWSKTEVAKKLGISYSAYSNYEYGNREPNQNMTKKIANTYGVSVLYLLEGKEKIAELGNVDVSFLLTGISNDTNLSSMDFLRLVLENTKSKELANKESYKRLNNFLWSISDTNFDRETINLLYSSLLFAQLNEPSNKDSDPKKIRFLNYIINHLNANIKKDTNFTTDELVDDLSGKLRYIIEN